MAEMVEGVATDIIDVMRCIADAFRSTGFDVVLDLAPMLPNVAVPPAVTETVLTGLVENSRQAGARRVSISGRADASIVELAVRDDGPGIPASDRDRIFKPFFTSRRAAGGTGLGLPIIRSLLQAHRGTIVLGQAKAADLTFLLALPSSDVPPTRKK